MNRFKTFKKVLIMVLVFAIILTQYNITSASANENEKTQNKYTINTPYEFPVKPGTDEWKKLETRAEKINVCQIPKDVLKKMTTEALAETVINYPLRADMFAQTSPIKGYQEIHRIFNGLQELASRSDAVDKLKKCKEKLPLLSVTKDTDRNILVSAYTDIIINGVNTFADSNISATTNGYYTTVCTPNKTDVEAFYDQTWDECPYSEALVRSTEFDLQELYPNAIKLRDVSCKYNCHSYAWYSTSTLNFCWIDDPSAYKSDGSYREVTNPVVGAKVYYDNGNHSGIVTSISGGVIKVRSKWGYGGLYEHTLYNLPYDAGSHSFWVRNY